MRENESVYTRDSVREREKNKSACVRDSVRERERERACVGERE